MKVSQTILTSSDAAGPDQAQRAGVPGHGGARPTDIDAYGKRVALQPDMLLKADVIPRSDLLSAGHEPVTKRADVTRDPPEL